ncbi:bZIP transcription factor 17 [Dichanthelium oligosanthes]|uniref:BZIP transcription factor 17 n=1 Tax=Dichanthelium oligosanthes TaxID=888268 RepID=A0A1E5WGW2_9POAL|nr:bZIP transcription factor 17 [Dichanthelium oligosanthes]
MAEPALLDLRHYPAHLFDPDFPLAGGDLPLDFAGDDDLDFDLPVDFSVDDFLLRSPDRGVDGDDSGEGSAAGSGPAASSSASPATSAANSAGDREVKHEDSDEGRSGAAPNWSLKRKQASPGASSDGAKCRRSGDGDLSPSASASASASRAAAAEDSDERGAGGEEEDKRRTARLMRNRESAQLSRQRKKRYVEELEEKVKSMHSVINDLNSKITFIAAENATLRQQLGGGGVSGPPPGVYPPPPLPGIHFPWVPGYAMRPHGSHVPLVPIPRLKPQQTAAAVKASKKPEVKKTVENKSKTKTKKVASVSFLGLLFVALVFGAFVPGFNHNFGMGDRSDNVMFGNFGHSDARVFSVTNHGKGPKGGLNSSNMIDTDPAMMTGNADGAGQKHRPAHNSSETLPALLYVPRNGKHVKINGNLIIHSVLASEKAVAHRASNGQSVKDHKETSVAIARYLSPSGKDMNSKETFPPDAPLPQWFREGMEGNSFALTSSIQTSSYVMCEVFQFDISASPAKSGGIIPGSPTVNSSSVNATQKIPSGKLKNRRIMYNKAIPLPGKTVNNTEARAFNSTSESSKVPDSKPASSVVVSVLADPREAGNGDVDPRVSPKPLSKIFVVVLVDGVRYVTYSCTLPFKSASPHLVN